MRHIHLDPVGGVAGDMFAACLLDAFPELAAGTIAAAQLLAPVHCALVPHRDHVLAGSRFAVRETHARHSLEHGHGHEHHHEHGPDHGHHHDHVHWSAIETAIQGSALAPEVKAHAIGIFGHLAEAEGRVHGIAPAQVAFHEVGAADSIADIVAAAYLIAAIGPASWSVSPLPLGSGTVDTAHGRLPVPAPATTLLLRGLPMVDDGVAGERVTPTGAAILRHLGCGDRPAGLRMGPTGLGFGTRTLPGLSNCLRAMVFERDGAPIAGGAPPHRSLLVVTFEVDDQSGEDLATGIERLRAMPAVHDVLIMPAYGKKGRMATQVQVLARHDEEEAVVAACFAQTTTIGLRTQIVAARALPRRIEERATALGTVRVKRVERPGGATVKAELDDLATAGTHAERAHLRRLAEAAS